MSSKKSCLTPFALLYNSTYNTPQDQKSVFSSKAPSIVSSIRSKAKQAADLYSTIDESTEDQQTTTTIGEREATIVNDELNDEENNELELNDEIKSLMEDIKADDERTEFSQ